MGIMSWLAEAKKKSAFLPALIAGGPIVAVAAAKPKETMEAAAGMVKNIAKAGVQLTVQNPAIAEIAGIVGGESAKRSIMRPRNVPLLGEVKPLSAVPKDIDAAGAQTSGETAAEAGNIFLEAGLPGVGKIVTKGMSAVKKTLPSVEKIGEFMSGVSKTALEKARNPEMAKAIKDLRAMGVSGTPEDAASFGEDVYTSAQKAKKAAMDAYGKTKDAIIQGKQGQIIQRAKEFVTGVEDAMKSSRVKVVDGTVDLVGSAFEGSGSAQAFLQRAHGIMTRPLVQGAEAVEDLITRREALSGILDEVPLAEKNLRRVLGDMRTAFDSTLENVLGKDATTLRESYAKAIEPTKSIIKAMTTDGKFSIDKARSFMEQAMSTVKFDKRKLLSELDSVTGTRFSKIAEAIGVDKAISQLEPPTRGRVLDVVKSYLVGNPLTRIVTPFFSPKFWGEISLIQGTKKATKAIKEADKFRSWFLTNILTVPVRDALEKSQTGAAQNAFEESYGAEEVGQISPQSTRAFQAEVDDFSDEDFAETFGAEPVE
ncbi:MAG: hypothetical protein WC763_05255 [Candidatus Paceibacterota bacterium]|jgi:hypothetical protein